MQYGIYYAYWEKQWGAEYLPYVEKVARLGFDILEISCAGLKDMSDAQIEALRAAKEKYGIRLTGGYGPKASENIASADPSIVAGGMSFWRNTFPVLQKLGITLVGGGLYGYWPVDYSIPPDKEGDWTRSVQNMRLLADMAAQYGITLGMEVLNRHEGYLINSAAECVRYVKAAGKPNVKVMLDTYHMNMEEDSFIEAILTSGSLLGHLHVGENNRRLPGQGNMIPWEEIGKALKSVGYNGTVVMEPFVIHGGQVGQDIRIWRDLLADTSEERLDEDAACSVKFLRDAFESRKVAPDGLAHVGLFITDMQRSVEFYTKVLDFKIIWQIVNPSPEGNIQVTFVQNGNLILELVQFAQPQTRADGCFDHIALHIKDLDTVMEELSARGISFEEDSRIDAPRVFERGSRWVFFRGPDNEHIELNEVF